MQSIIHTECSYSFISPLLHEFELLYQDTSEKSLRTPGNVLIRHEYPEVFKEIMNLFAQYGYGYDLQYTSKTSQKVDICGLNDRALIICFSGGKDSLAAIKHYQRMGYDITLYHITGLNKSYTTEHESVKTLAKKLKLPLVIEDISYKGQHEWIEHPLKNIIMAGMALNYALNHKIGYKVAVGNFYTARLDDNVFEVCAGDCIEMWRAWERCIKTIIPKFHVFVPLINYHQSYNLLIRNHAASLIPDVQSCMTPNRFRNLFKERTETKFHMKLLPNRCGCCWKCAVEYIWLCDHTQLCDVDKNYYMHCLQILQNNCKKERNMIYNNISDLWDDYFFYPMSHSIFKEDLKNAVI